MEGEANMQGRLLCAQKEAGTSVGKNVDLVGQVLAV